ncbi:MAG: hypothetical protein JNK46_14220 [Methylobacteriaceae bacterium]|nr:hypothetical protein [Methylobacteriaceae bacterium]
MQERRRALIRAWMRDPLILVQAEAPGALAGLVFLDDRGAGATTARAGRIDAQSAAIVRRPGDAHDNASLWVAASYDGYRRAYLRFLADVYGARASEAELDGWDIDHLLNRARAPLATSFVRLEAIPAEANRRWGALFEKAASDERFYANRRRERRTMSWMICAKLAGKPPPKDPDDAAQIEHLVAFFASIGLNPGEARRGVGEMLDFVYRA